MKDETLETIGTQITAILERIGQICRDTHGGIAIVAASIIAESLLTVLRSKMRPLSKSFEKRLFEGYGPLSSFSSRIDMSFALDLVSDEMRKDLNTLREIRNTFAHSNKILYFHDPEIAGLCGKLSTSNGKKADLNVYLESVGRIDDHLQEMPKQTAGRVNPDDNFSFSKRHHVRVHLGERRARGECTTGHGRISGIETTLKAYTSRSIPPSRQSCDGSARRAQDDIGATVAVIL